MLRHAHPNVFMTLTLLILDLSSLTAEFAIGGPPCPLLHRSGHCAPLTTQSGWTLGYPFGGVSFQSESLPLAHGDTLLFYTDGLSDATRGPDRERETLGADGLATISPTHAAGGPGMPTRCARGSSSIGRGGRSKTMPRPLW
jgi:serine phosphatase RsbU (regulator of sigma subunit)